MASAFAFTTLALVKEALSTDFGTSTSNDGFVGTLIGEVSTRMEQALERQVDQIERTEVYDFKPGQKVLELCNWPVTAVSTVKLARDGDFASADAREATTYLVDEVEGRLIFHTSAPIYSPYRGETYYQALQVVYTGGMAADESAFQAAYPDLVGAATRQVVHAFKRRDTPGNSTQGSQRSFSRGATTPYGLLPDVHAAIQRYRRLVVA